MSKVKTTEWGEILYSESGELFSYLSMTGYTVFSKKECKCCGQRSASRQVAHELTRDEAIAFLEREDEVV